MGTKIQWTDITWNPVTGCNWISPGCNNCYAEKMAKRLKFIKNSAEKYRNGFDITCHPDELKRFWQKKQQKIFVCSMGDLFHKDVPFSFIEQVLLKIARNPRHIFQILTKRPERALEFQKLFDIKLPDNVWFGVTVENKEKLHRIETLGEIHSRIKFVSFEPLLEDIGGFNPLPVNWVIVGGETGPQARTMNPDWARDIKRTCDILHIPFFFKQMSKKQSIPNDLMIREFPEE